MSNPVRALISKNAPRGTKPTCQVCLINKGPQPHHLDTKEKSDRFIPICSDCHKVVHGIIPYGQIPQYNTAALLRERLSEWCVLKKRHPGMIAKQYFGRA